jgi:prepilin-type N-terminal cleavage/methylation domain-containing protein
MEENLMLSPRNKHLHESQRGFTMVEMLMTAFILAVGILGLTMLQVVSLKGTRGSKSLATGVQVAESVMDQIEMEGRLSWLNITATNFKPATPLTTLKYINKLPLAAPLVFTTKGLVPVANAPDPVDSTAFYQVSITQNDVPTAGTGTMSLFSVDVQFSDQTNPTTGVAIPRHVVIRRSVLHG